MCRRSSQFFIKDHALSPDEIVLKFRNLLQSGVTIRRHEKNKYAEKVTLRINVQPQPKLCRQSSEEQKGTNAEEEEKSTQDKIISVCWEPEVLSSSFLILCYSTPPLCVYSVGV